MEGTEHSTVWIVEFQTEDQPGQWFVHDVTLYTPPSVSLMSVSAVSNNATFCLSIPLHMDAADSEFPRGI